MFYMDLINLGPIRISLYNDPDHLNLSFGFEGDKGLVTSGRLGFRSQHLTLAKGGDNQSDTFVCPRSGTTYFGKPGLPPVTARQVYSIEMDKIAKQAQIDATNQAIAPIVS